MDNYLLNYEKLSQLTINEFLKKIEATEGKVLRELKVSDLTYYNNAPIIPAEGVYIFREDKKIIYVGKVTSMSFTERIPKHFDTRHKAWFNRLLKIICEKHPDYKSPITDENLRTASKYAFENLNLVLINFENRDRINSIEKLIRATTNTLNKFKTLRENDKEKPIASFN